MSAPVQVLVAAVGVSSSSSPPRATHARDSGAVMRCLRENMADLVGPFGVLLFLYSVVLTKAKPLTLPPFLPPSFLHTPDVLTAVALCSAGG